MGLFRKEPRQTLVKKAAEDRAEKLLAESLRMLGQTFQKLADLVDAQRLSKQGYEEQEKFLTRLDGPGAEK